MNGPQDHVRAQPADVLEIVFQYPLLGRHLRGRVDMLHRAAAAGAEVHAPGPHPQRAFAIHFKQVRRFPFGLAAEGLEAHQFTRQRAFDEDDLAGRAVVVLQMADAAGFHVEGFDFYACLGHVVAEVKARRGGRAKGEIMAAIGAAAKGGCGRTRAQFRAARPGPRRARPARA